VLQNGFYLFNLGDDQDLGLANQFRALFLQMVDKKIPKKNQQTLEFTRRDLSQLEHNLCVDLQAELLGSKGNAGVCTSLTKRSKYQTNFKFNIEFFEKKDYEDLMKDLELPEKVLSERRETARNSLSTLATLRFKYFDAQPLIREDLILRGKVSVDSKHEGKMGKGWSISKDIIGDGNETNVIFLMSFMVLKVQENQV
jgi:hypothetical protein